MADDGFIRREAAGIAFYVCGALEEAPNLRHGFSMRHGGVSPLPHGALNLSFVPWDAPDHVIENRNRLLSALGLRDTRLATLSQVHSDRLHIIEESTWVWNRRMEGDALATRQKGIALAVQVADCFPILLADPGTGAIAALHAGWRGTLAHIVVRTVAGLVSAFGTDLAHLLAAIGPGIGPCCYEVGAEVAELYEAAFARAGVCRPHPVERGKYLLDLRSALGAQLAKSGVRRENIFDLDACTRCNMADFFSYRGEGPRTGRMMGVIGNYR